MEILSFVLLSFLLGTWNNQNTLVSSSSDTTTTTEEQLELTINLNNDKPIPLIGVGLGFIAHDKVPAIVQEALSSNDNLGYTLIDTSHRSGNERILAETIADLVTQEKQQLTIDIVTNVWYTHLGYERTMISLKESVENIMEPLKETANISIRIHFIIAWPRCYPKFISWMRCEEEEAELPDHIKQAGDHPTRYSYLASWRAMEHFYLENQPLIGSLGVANFDSDDLSILVEASRIKPSIYQANIELLFEVLPLLQKYEIMSQVLSLFEVISRRDTPRLDIARSHLVSLADELSTETKIVHPATLLIHFLIKNKVGIHPQTTNLMHLQENSPRQVLEMPVLNTTHEDRLNFILRSGLFHWKQLEEDSSSTTKEEGPAVHLNFFNKSPSKSINVFWINEETKEQHQVLEKLKSGDNAYLKSHPGHSFIAYDTETGEEIRKFQVNAEYGRSEWFSVEF